MANKFGSGVLLSQTCSSLARVLLLLLVKLTLSLRERERESSSFLYSLGQVQMDGREENAGRGKPIALLSLPDPPTHRPRTAEPPKQRHRRTAEAAAGAARASFFALSASEVGGNGEHSHTTATTARQDGRAGAGGGGCSRDGCGRSCIICTVEVRQYLLKFLSGERY